MALHFDSEIIKADLHDLVDACIQGITGTNTHQQLAKRLRDEGEPNRRTAQFSIVANCVSCTESIICAVETIWHRGSPISIRMHDESCPACGRQAGFRYDSLHSFKA